MNWTTSKKWRAKENVSKSQTKINYYYGIFVVHVAKVYWIPNVFLCAKVPILFFCFSQFFVLAFGFFSSLCLGLNPTLYFSFALFFLFYFPAYVCFCVCCVMIATSSRLPMCIAYIKLFQHRRLNLKKKNKINRKLKMHSTKTELESFNSGCIFWWKLVSYLFLSIHHISSLMTWWNAISQVFRNHFTCFLNFILFFYFLLSVTFLVWTQKFSLQLWRNCCILFTQKEKTNVLW